MLACSNTAWLQASLACTAKSAALFQKPFGHCFGRNAPDRSLWTSNKSSSFFTPGTCFTETASKHPCTETCWPCKQICQTYQSCQATQAVVFQCQTLQLLVPNLQVALVWHLDFSLDFSRTPHLLLSNIFLLFFASHHLLLFNFFTFLRSFCWSSRMGHHYLLFNFSLFSEAFVSLAGFARDPFPKLPLGFFWSFSLLICLFLSRPECRAGVKNWQECINH